MTGATVIDRVSVLVTHLSSIVTDNAARLLSREDVRVLTDGVKEVNPSAVDELIPGALTLAEVQRVLQGLLAEQVPINDLPRIYEALTLRAKVSTDPEGLIEAARQALGPALASRHLDGQLLRVIMIDPLLEQSMLEGMRPSDHGTQILMDPRRIEAVLASLRESPGRRAVRRPHRGAGLRAGAAPGHPAAGLRPDRRPAGAVVPRGDGGQRRTSRP